MTTTRGTFWSVTINNPTVDDEECIAKARQRGWTVEGQLEKVGTPHYQLAVRTPQVRFSAVKKAFPRAHIELARNVAALQQYVNKEETRVGSLPTTNEKYPSLTRYWDLLLRYFIEVCGKDGLDGSALGVDAMSTDIVFFNPAREQIFITTPLVLLDEATTYWITDGYFVEQHATNPQVRQQWKLFSRAIMARAWGRSRQQSETARQTDSVLSVEIPSAIEDTNSEDADDDATSQASSRVLGQVNDGPSSPGSSAETGSEDSEGSD